MSSVVNKETICNICGKVFDFPYLLERHKQNKKTCRIKSIEFECLHCCLCYANKYTLKKHMNKCKENKNAKADNEDRNTKDINTNLMKALFINFIEHLGLTADILNQTHAITNIVDENTYQIIIDRINLNNIKNLTNGGYACEILVPREMRLLFTFSDSMGEQIGFRNIGDTHSITKFSTIITNKDSYENETIYDSLRNTKIFTNASLTFYKDQYIIMTCKELSIIKNTRQPIDIFAKINFTKDEILIDEIICPPVFYYNPIDRLSELTFEFYTPDGKQYDFNNIDHSFVLEFTMMDNIPENTGLLSNNSNAR